MSKVIPIVVQNQDRIIRRKDYEQFGDRLLVTGFWRTIQGEGPYSGHPAVFLRLAGCNFGDKVDHCNFCFPSTKQIQSPQGTRQMQDLRVGDLLFALDADFNLTTTQIKKKLTRRVSQEEFVRVFYEASRKVGGARKRHSIVCTAEHPFHVKDKGFIAAKDLTLDDVIYHVKGNETQSLQKRINNPMHDATVAAKVHNQLRAKRASGELKEYERTAWHRKNLSELRKVRNAMFDPASQLKMLRNKKYPKSGTEKLVEKLFKAIEVSVTYVGNKRSFVVGTDAMGYSRPDFVVGNKVFEVYDTTYPHYAEGLRNKDNYEIPKRRFYKKLGYEVMFINQDTLGGKFKITEQSIAKFGMAVNKFLKNGARVVGVEYLDNKGFSQLDVGSDGKVEVTNFSCHPYNTFIVDGLHTHNCDTSFQFNQGTAYTHLDLLTALQKLPGYRKSDILVITGGEPTLQPALIDFLRNVGSLSFRRVQIETNGTQVAFFKALDEELRADKPEAFWQPSIVISPKASAAAGRIPELSPVVLKYASCLKFVVSCDPNDPQHTIPDWAFNARDNHKTVYVSPMAVYKKPYAGEVSSIWEDGLLNKEATAANYAYAAQYAMDNGLLLSLQTHLFTAIP